MDLTPKDIQEKRFHEKFRGYNEEEVDVFLDSVADSYERIYRESQELKQRIRKLEERLNEAEGTESMLKRTLLAAQKSADEAVSEAKEQSRSLVGDAQEKADKIIADAESRASEIVRGADDLRKEAESRYEKVRGFVGTYRKEFQEFVNRQLKSLEGIPAPESRSGTSPGQDDAEAQDRPQATQEPRTSTEVVPKASKPQPPPKAPPTQSPPTQAPPPKAQPPKAQPPKAQPGETSPPGRRDARVASQGGSSGTEKAEVRHPVQSPDKAEGGQPKQSPDTAPKVVPKPFDESMRNVKPPPPEAGGVDDADIPPKPTAHGEPPTIDDEEADPSEEDITELFWGEE